MVRLATLVYVITLQTFNLLEFLLERLGQIIALLLEVFILILQVLFDDQPVDVSVASELYDLSRRIGIHRMIEQEHGKLRPPSGRVIEEVFSGDDQYWFGARNVGVRVSH